MKLAWLADNMPGRQSIQKLVHAAIEAYTDKLLAQYNAP